MGLRDKARVFVGSKLVQLGVRIMGGDALEQARREMLAEEADDGDEPVGVVAVKPNAVAREMLAEGAGMRRAPPRPDAEALEPRHLVGSVEWRRAHGHEGV